MLDVFKKVFGSANERAVRRYRGRVDRINALEPEVRKLSDEALRGRTAELRQRVDAGAPLDEVLFEAFAVVRETGRRVMEMRHFDVQLIGGIVLHEGKVAEMKTGEGKTLVATLPVYLNALSGQGVHVVTVNDYLAARDAEWMGRIYRHLGLDVGVILSNERDSDVKRRAYQAAITYGTNNEFGFDYLRDNMKYRIEDYVQRGHHFAIVDEVDSILIDEARTPLIISGQANFPVDRYYVIDGVVPLLQNEIHYTLDEKSRQVQLTDEGITRVEEQLKVGNLFDVHNMEVLHHVNQALRAHVLYMRDRDYVVEHGQVVIVDEHTGRLMPGRRWSDGLHQAVEAKEKLRVEAESQTYATITFQNHFRMYKKLAGMTGTADTEAAEFHKIYGLEVVVIPTNVPVARKDEHDIVFRTEDEKFRAVLKDIVDAHTRGQPVLVGTTSVKKSEIVSRMLEREGIPHEVLNAKNHARESQIIAQAGRLGRVTISTNMAGRGTDIKLGGNAEEMAKDAGRAGEDLELAMARFKSQVEEERGQVLAVGGLRVIGTERHESRRIDNQLRGRSGRQGDPGSSKFYLSLEDDLLRIFGSDRILAFMDRFGLQDDEPVESRLISSSIEGAQKKVEGQHFNYRKNLLEYDDVLNQQRKHVYELRRRALTGEGIDEMLREAIEGVVDDLLDDHASANLHPEDWNLAGLRERLAKLLGVEWPEGDDAIRDMAQADLRARLLGNFTGALAAKREELGDEAFLQIARQLLLQFTDSLWRDHLLAMDRLRDGVSLRGYGQRNPLLEYKKEGFNMFMMMNALRDEQLVSTLARVRLAPPESARPVGGPSLQAPSRPALPPAQPEPDAVPAPEPVEPPRPPEAGDEARLYAFRAGIRRNDPCPCESGKKYKKCCYLPDWEPPPLEGEQDVLAGSVDADGEARPEA